MFHSLYQPVTFNESIEKNKLVFCYFLAKEKTVAPLSSSNLPMKKFVEECLYLFVFKLYCFQQVFHMLLVYFLRVAGKKVFLSIEALKSLISSNDM